MSEKCKEAFIKAGFWPNQVTWRAWENAWKQGAEDERESCANICEDREQKCAAKLETTDDQDDRIELKANAWQFSVLAAEIRKRSNV